jgi:hypothetical protein
MHNELRGLSRRDFMRRSIFSAGMLPLASIGLSADGADSSKEPNPFAYDVDRLTRTDPRLLSYEQVTRFRSPNSAPRRIAIGAEDRLYIAGKNGVTVLTSEGAVLKELALQTPARCVAVAADGTVFAGVRNHVEVFDSKGHHLKSWDAPGKKTWLTGLAVGESELFAADSGERAVLRYDRSGRLLGRIGEKSKETNVPGLVVPSPYLDVELGRDGLLRVNNPGRHCIEVYTTGGELELSWGKPSAAIEGFCGCCNPIGLALLPDGRCITCEKGLPRVKLYAADGAFECVVAGPESFPENTRAGAARDLSDGTLGGVDATVDSQGCIYILDLVATDVRVMKPKG